MKNYIFSFITILVLSGTSCKYLEVVPDDKSTLQDAFKSESEAQKTLYGLYSSIPEFFTFEDSPTFTGTDESITSQKGATYWYPYKSIIYEEYSVNDPYFNYWSNQPSRIKRDLYEAIHKCYQFINKLPDVPNLSEQNKITWTAEAEFLIAYYHFTLMQFYGPIIIADQEFPIDLAGSKLFKSRSTYDDCVTFVVNKLDKAAKDLPAIVLNQDLGKASSVIAKSLKSRVLLYAASPLYNGNSEFYGSFKNPDGTNLINQTYQAQKWEAARTAAKDAIDAAQQANIFLYETKIKQSADPFQQAVYNYRYLFVDKWNTETIWGITRTTGSNRNSRYIIPKISASGSERPFGNIVPTFTTVAQYYTKDGLPLNVDPATKDVNLWVYSDPNKTALINLNREPRFYASIAYDGGSYEFGGSSFNIDARAGQTQGYASNVEYNSSTGYFFKKWAHPDNSYNAVSNKYTSIKYPYPELRLAELYLNYVEADAEFDGTLSGEGLKYLNEIRKRSGIPSFEQSWQKVGGMPQGTQLRDVIRQERSIEFMLENKRFFDLRRWKTAHIELNKQQNAWNIYGTTKQDFYKVVKMDESGQRKFTSPKSYLLPIHIQDINMNENLVQNPGW